MCNENEHSEQPILDVSNNVAVRVTCELSLRENHSFALSPLLKHGVCSFPQ